MGLKPGDNYTVPLCVEHHHEQHEVSEKVFWGESLESVKRLANDLWNVSGSEQGKDKIREFRHERDIHA